MRQPYQQVEAEPDEARATTANCVDGQKTKQPTTLLGGCIRIITAYVGCNHIPIGDLPGIISEVHRTLQAVVATTKTSVPTPIPAVPPERSVADEYIVCLEDGKRFKSLKRHLRTKYGMTPDEYRVKWGLESNYPMTAPDYTRRRSGIAKQSRQEASGKINAAV